MAWAKWGLKFQASVTRTKSGAKESTAARNRPWMAGTFHSVSVKSSASPGKGAQVTQQMVQGA
jgi:hypothetical protein